MKSKIQKWLFLIAGLLVSLNASAYHFMIDGLAYDKNGDGKSVSVTSGNIKYSGDIVIPENVIHNDTTYSVTVIGACAFYGCGYLKSVTIPNSVTLIGESAFQNCKGLTSVTIPNSVTSIGASAFYGCTRLTSVTIPNSVTSIGGSAFYTCYELTSITIPNSVTSIGERAFNDCQGLTSITIPNSVTSIGDRAFERCTGLKVVNMLNPNPPTLGAHAFGLPKIYVPKGSLQAYKNATYWQDENIKEGLGVSIGNFFYELNETTKTAEILGRNNISLTSIDIPSSVTFNGQTYSVTSIGERAFEGCTGLTSVTIPNSVTSIGAYAFLGCWYLKSVTIPNSVTSIGVCAFTSCIRLTSIDIPNSVTSIGNRAFNNCTGLTSVIIGESVTSIGERAFNDCTGLTSITLPNSVISIGESAFENCTGLTSVTIPNSVTSIGSSVFLHCAGLTSVTIPNSVTSIGGSAFSGCTSLTSITIPNSVTSVGVGAFGGTGLTSITIPNSVTSIGTWAFSGCSGLTSVTIPNSVTSIGESPFEDCPGLTSLVVERGNPKYDSRDNCNAIIETATNTLIQGCNTTVIPNTVTSIGESAFEGCTGLTSVTIPNSVWRIASYAFLNCTSLTSVTIGNSVTLIGTSAFSGCTGLNEVISLNPTPPRCQSSFSGYGNLYVPIGCVEVYKKADVWLSFTNIQEIEHFIDNNKLIYYYNKANKTAELAGTTDSYIMDLVVPNTVSFNGEVYSVTSIARNAFKDRRFLMTVSLGENVEYVAREAFAGTRIEEINISNLKNWCNMEHYASNLRLSVPGKMSLNGNVITDLTIPDGVTKINDFSFYNCQNISSVTLPNSLKSIGTQAFDGCKRLSSITIPSSVISIGASAFLNCNLRSITIDDLNWWFRTDNNMCLQGPGMIYLNGVLIKHLIIPEGITEVRTSAFRNCESVTGITIPNSVIVINDQAFIGCSNLQNVIVGESVRIIGMQVFKGCPNIKEITCLGSLPAIIYADTFQNYDATLFVPGGRLNHYKSAEHWLNFNRMTEGVSGVEGIESDGIKVVAKGGAIEVSGADGECVEVYSLSGQCVYSGMETSIPVAKGIYIVRVAGTVHKVIL